MSLRQWLWFNLAVAAVTAIGSWPENMFVMFGAVVIFLGTAIVNLVAPITLWNRDGPKCLLVPLSFVVAVLALHPIAWYARELESRQSPTSPATYFRDDVRVELERVGEELLGNGYTQILVTGPDAGTARMRSGISYKDVPRSTTARLRKLGFDRVEVDDTLRVVTYCHVRYRTWHQYSYSPGGTQLADTIARRIAERWTYRGW